MIITSNIDENNVLVVRERTAGESVVFARNDNEAVKCLNEVASLYSLEKNGGKRLECIMILEELTSLWLLQTVGVPDSVFEKVDLMVSSPEDLLAKKMFVSLPGEKSSFPPLDRMPISFDSDSTVHLVIIGKSSFTETIAINAALVAHYPNFCRDTRLRTRITLIDEDVFSLCEQMTQRYAHLFEHSWYRTLDLSDSSPQCVTHAPLYHGKRKDFVDLEWEFVKGNVRNHAVRSKLAEWSESPVQQLTVCFCHDDDKRNFSESLSLPEKLYNSKTPIFFHALETDLLRLMKETDFYASVFPYGNEECDILTLKRLKQLAKGVNYVYNHCFSLSKDEPVTAPASIDSSIADQLWDKVGSMPKVYSNIFNAMTLGTKMHSIGHTKADWETYYALSKDEINILTEVEHNRWSVEELILGYRPVNDEEERLVENDISMKKKLRSSKIHYDLRSFDDLREDSTGKNVNVYDMALTQGIPLIIRSCITD